MTDKELVDAVEAIKEATYDITQKKVNKITSEYKYALKAIQDERSRRGHIRSQQVNYGCSDCVLHEIQTSFVPFIEGKGYQALQASLNQVPLQMIPDSEEVEQPVKGKPDRKKR